MEDRISIIIADDHLMFVDGLKLLLNQQADYNVVAQANNGKELLEILINVPAKLLLLDINMPVLNGVEGADGRPILLRGMTINAVNNIRENWNATTSLLVYQVRSELLPTVKQASLSLKSIHTISFKRIADLDIYAEYMSPYLDANARRASIFEVDMGFTRKVGVHKLRFYVTDLFNSVREKDITRYNNTSIDFYQKRPTQTFSFSFTYNFKRGKTFTQKKAEQTNNDEKSRL